MTALDMKPFTKLIRFVLEDVAKKRGLKLTKKEMDEIAEIALKSKEYEAIVKKYLKPKQ